MGGVGGVGGPDRSGHWMWRHGATSSAQKPTDGTTDGVVVLRPSRPDDVPALIAGRDDEARRWLGPGSPAPAPVACVVVDGEIVGWVDWDVDAEHGWLRSGEVNVGYSLFAAHRGRGYASRAVQLLLHRLALADLPVARTATLLIDRGNAPSLALARRLGFVEVGDGREVEGNVLLARPVPPLTYTDGVVAIRRQRVDDLDMDLESKDDAQIEGLWLPGHREKWEAMSPAQQREHGRAGLAANHDAFGRGPKWTFAVDAVGGDEVVSYVAYVDCDLANSGVPRGEANIAYSADPAHRGRGYVSRAVRLLLRFLADHTGAREAHIRIDPRNTASLRVAVAVGGVPTSDDDNGGHGDGMIRHVVAITRP